MSVVFARIHACGRVVCMRNDQKCLYLEEVPMIRKGTGDRRTEPGKLRIEGLESGQSHLSSIAPSLDLDLMSRMLVDEPSMHADS